MANTVAHFDATLKALYGKPLPDLSTMEWIGRGLTLSRAELGYPMDAGGYIKEMLNMSAVLLDIKRDMNRQVFGDPSYSKTFNCEENGMLSRLHKWKHETIPGHVCYECIENPGFMRGRDEWEDPEWEDCWACHGRLFIPTRYKRICTRCNHTEIRG